jgi:hypothetical protein
VDLQIQVRNISAFCDRIDATMVAQLRAAVIAGLDPAIQRRNVASCHAYTRVKSAYHFNQSTMLQQHEGEMGLRQSDRQGRRVIAFGAPMKAYLGRGGPPASFPPRRRAKSATLQQTSEGQEG